MLEEKETAAEALHEEVTQREHVLTVDKDMCKAGDGHSHAQGATLASSKDAQRP